MSTKIHATTDALGNPLSFHLTPGQAGDLDGSDLLLPKLTAQTILADKGYEGASHFLLLFWRIMYQEPLTRQFSERGYFYLSGF